MELTAIMVRMDNEKKIDKHFDRALALIILMAIVSCFSDVTHEGASSMSGAFISFLGADTMVVSIVGGAAALLGYGLRFITGWITDKTKAYWPITIIGYLLDLSSVPLLALVPNGGWGWAVALILFERIAKAIKKPARDTITSFAAYSRGVGKTFAFNEILDQIGACVGPLILTAVYTWKSNFGEYDKFIMGFAFLAVPAVICFSLVIVARILFPHPEKLEKEKATDSTSFLAKESFILFLVATGLLALGFEDSYTLLSKHMVHLSSEGLISLTLDQLPLLYSYAMLIDAFSAAIFGILYDKLGFKTIVVSSVLTAFYSFFVFLIPSTWAIFVGLALWGMEIGAKETSIKSAAASLSPKGGRATSFGMYEMVYGVFAFLGSFLYGWLYEASKLAMCIVSAIFVVLAAIIYAYSGLCFRKEKVLNENIVIK